MEDKKNKSSATLNDKFELKMKFNGKEYECKTSNLSEAIMQFKPNFLKTNVNFYCKSKEGICNKVVLAKRAKMMFRNKVYLDMFINQLIFKS